jgi:hypothetical protein
MHTFHRLVRLDAARVRRQPGVNEAGEKGGALRVNAGTHVPTCDADG